MTASVGRRSKGYGIVRRGFSVKIAFTCRHCGSRLVVDSALAGRVGRCRSCGRRVTVPEGTETAKVTPPVAAKHPSPPPAPAPANSPTGNYRLRPVTPVHEPAIEVPGWGNDDTEMVVVRPPVPVAARPTRAEPTPWLKAYRAGFSVLVNTTTWISETSYTVSMILLILAVAAGMIGQHTLALWGVRGIIGLNLVGFAGDVASLVNLSFRRDPLRGALFLLPPLTLYYLWTDWRRYRDTVGRMRIPLATLTFVAVACLFIPWLRGGNDDGGSVVATTEQIVGDLEERFGGQRGQLEATLKAARSWHREGAALAPPAGGDQPAPGAGS